MNNLIDAIMDQTPPQSKERVEICKKITEYQRRYRGKELVEKLHSLLNRA